MEIPDYSSDRRHSSKPFTVALIGCGAVSQMLYAPALDKLASEGLVVTVALVDPNPERCFQIGGILSTASDFRDLKAMFAAVTPDIAIIAAPHRHHADLVVSCLEKTAGVLCEKPMAMTAAECDRMIAAADHANRVFAVGHFRRFFPSAQLVKTILSNGLLGSVRSFRVLEGETYSWPAQSASFFKRNDSGGGVLIDAGAHTIDLLLWWLGDVADFEYEDDTMGGVEANCRLRLKMNSGANGIVQLSRDWPLPNRYVIECEKGWLAYICDKVDCLEWGLYDSEYGLETQIRMMTDTVQPHTYQLGAAGPAFLDCFVNQLRNVLAAVNGQEMVCVSGIEARKTVALIEACYRKRKLLEMPWLEPAELLRARQLNRV
jgi:predicted dehydrogenase